MGILNSKGEFIMNLDPDDEFEGPDNLEYLYKTAKKAKVDIISFSVLYKCSENIINKCNIFHKIHRQPKIFESVFNSTNNIKDFLIWNKLIKREIYLQAYDIFKSEIHGAKWNYHEDNIWSILVNKFANKMLCVNKLIYIYNEINDSLMKKRFNIMELNNLIYRDSMYKKIFKLKKEEKYIIAEHLEIIAFFEESNSFYEILKNNYKIRKQITDLFINLTKTYSYSKKINEKIEKFLRKISYIIYN